MIFSNSNDVRKPTMNSVSTLIFNNFSSMRQEFVPPRSSVTSQTSMPMNNHYAPIDSIDLDDYFETPYASKSGDTSYTCPQVHGTPNVRSSGMVANDFITRVNEIYARRYPVRTIGLSKGVREQLTKTLSEFGFETMDRAESYQKSYLGSRSNSGQVAGMVLENERPVVDQYAESAMFVEEQRKPFVLPSEFHAKTTVDEAKISDICTRDIADHAESLARIQIGDHQYTTTVGSKRVRNCSLDGVCEKEPGIVEPLNSVAAEIDGLKLVHNPFNEIDFDNKRVLIRSSQAESTKGKNVIASDEYITKMVKPRGPEIKVWKKRNVFQWVRGSKWSGPPEMKHITSYGQWRARSNRPNYVHLSEGMGAR
jgi:ribosomal protein S17E